MQTSSHGVSNPAIPWLPTSPDIALIAMSETPNRMPAAAPSMKPWCSRGAPIRGPAISSVPPTTSAASNAIIPGTEKREWAP